MKSQPDRQFHVRKVAVCGAGVMGAQIAAHCANAGVPVVLYDLAANEEPKNAVAAQAIANLKKARPAPFGDNKLAKLITPASYDDDLHLLGECDLIIEAIAERLDWKLDLYKKLAPAIKPGAIIASNTSGLSINKLAQSLPESLRSHFCGVHFFNPPRYMALVELIPANTTQPQLLDNLETFLVSRLGKGVVRAKDTPNFIGNRIGIFGMLAVYHQAKKFGLSYELVDDLTGVRLGRARSGTYRTADVVGLDTMEHVVRTMRDGLTNDPFHQYFHLPDEVATLIANGSLGQKSGAGFFRRDGKAILRFDAATGNYVAADNRIDESVAAILAERDPAKRLAALRASSHPQAQFVWAVLRDFFHYSAVHLADIADTARQVDQVLVWGFAHKQGPFEVWQSAGWQQVAQWISEDIAQGKALCDTPLPDWVTQGPVHDNQGVQTADGSWNPSTQRFEPRSQLPVYQRQLAPALVYGEQPSLSKTVVFEDDALQCWTLSEPNNDVLIASLKTSGPALTEQAIDSLHYALEQAESHYSALVIGQLRGPFSSGADLKTLFATFEEQGPDAVNNQLIRLQNLTQSIYYAQIPVVAAIDGLALGAACELAQHCASRVATFESYLGFTDANVGLSPAAGGLTLIARRAATQQSRLAPQAPLYAFFEEPAVAMFTAQTSGSALEAQRLGFLRQHDNIVMNRHELMYVAIHQARALAETGWRPRVSLPIAVAGKTAYQKIIHWAEKFHESGKFSDYDVEIAQTITHALCAADYDAGELIDEAQMLEQERKAFLSLLDTAKAQERLQSYVTTGKPVKN